MRCIVVVIKQFMVEKLRQECELGLETFFLTFFGQYTKLPLSSMLLNEDIR